MTIQAEQTVARPQGDRLAEIIPIGAAAENVPLRIGILGYRSHPYGGGQGIYIKYLSKALAEAGHEVEVISGEPYPHLDPRVRLIKLPGMNIYEKGLNSLRPRHLRRWSNWVEWFGKLTGGFAEPVSFGMRVDKYLREHGHRYALPVPDMLQHLGTNHLVKGVIGKRQLQGIGTRQRKARFGRRVVRVFTVLVGRRFQIIQAQIHPEGVGLDIEMCTEHMAPFATAQVQNVLPGLQAEV